MERDRRGVNGLPGISLRLGLTLALGLATLAAPGAGGMWGLGAMLSWPFGARLGALAAGLLAVWWPWRSAPAPARRDRRALIAFSAALLAVWILLPVETLLFGDSAFIIARLGGSEPVTPRSPLYNLAAGALAAIFPDRNREGLAPGLRTLSVLCGILYLGVLARLARRGRLNLGAAGLLTAGTLCLFQGYIESYALPLAVMAAWSACLLEQRNRRRDVTLTLLSGLAVAAHGAGILLLPVTLLVLAGAGRGLSKRGIAIAAAGAAAILALVLFSGLLPAAFRDVDPADILRDFGRVTALSAHPWSGGIPSLEHWLDVLNGYWLSLGAVLFVIPAFLVYPGGRRALAKTLKTPVGWTAALFLLARLLVTTSPGPLLDWDLMSLFAWPVAFGVAMAWSEPEAERLRPLGPAVFVTAVILFAPWAMTLASKPSSTRFLVAYRDGSPPLRPFSAARVDYALGDELVRDGRQADAAELFSRARERYPRDVYARRAATAWLTAGNRDRALQEYEQAVRLNPMDLVSRRQLGLFYMEMERSEPAAQQFNAVVSAVNDDGRARFGLGLLAGQRGDRTGERDNLALAVTGLRRNLETDPGNSSDRLYLAEALNRLDRSAEALPELTRLLESNPGDSRAYYNLGVCYTNLGRYSEARDIFARGAALSPGSFKFLANLGGVNLILEDWRGAEAAYTKALAIRDVPVVRLDRARARLHLGEMERARADVDSVLALAPADTAALALKARVEKAVRR